MTMKKSTSFLVFFALALLLACQPSRVISPTQSASKQPASAQSSTHKQPSDIDFTATGKSPSWSVEIDIGKSITFYTMEGISTYATIPAPTSPDETAQVVYEATRATGKLTIN